MCLILDCTVDELLWCVWAERLPSQRVVQPQPPRRGGVRPGVVLRHCRGRRRARLVVVERRRGSAPRRIHAADPPVRAAGTSTSAGNLGLHAAPCQSRENLDLYAGNIDRHAARQSRGTRTAAS